MTVPLHSSLDENTKTIPAKNIELKQKIRRASFSREILAKIPNAKKRL